MVGSAIPPFIKWAYEKTNFYVSDAQYVESLQDQLARLRNNGLVALSSELKNDYEVLVEHLASSLLTPEIPLYCKTLPKTVHESAPVTSVPSTSNPPRVETKPLPNQSFQSLLKNTKLSDDARNTLEMHERLQESLTDDLLQMARAMKSKTIKLGSALEARDTAIDSTFDALEFSAVAARDSSKKAAKQYKTSKIGTCRMLLILLFMGCVFTAMVFFIRITSFVGYRARTEL